ncbi:sensor histidine kinase inhibitor, KipI family [Micromonospora nigra]|uniref:Sensor histidine kinase inhibitor, KipI family n=1 Tax=Micromonospora nigra TaxID=145857 RepID=A0A1C6S1A3_9ACTN|nr:carboxyltransferase domain-containing protein [Micromonospora nigra]SCL23259.1 sensor histidine kinase inhibitor, KipI family [Micromonospora nigra]
MRIRPVGAHALLLDLAPAPDDPVPAPDRDSAPDHAPAAGSSDAAPDRAPAAGGSDADADSVPAAGGPDLADRVEAWRAELWRRRENGELTAEEIVPAAATVLLDGVPDPAGTAARIVRWTPAATTATAQWTPTTAAARSTSTTAAVRTVDVPVTYDGEDLPLVAGHWGVDVPTVVHRLATTSFRVAFCGFAPGFAYLTGLPATLTVPRLATPRPRVPAGAVALAGPYAGIYPTASPGGWLLVGRTGLTLFDVHADPPARLAPGTRVHLVPA